MYILYSCFTFPHHFELAMLSVYRLTLSLTGWYDHIDIQFIKLNVFKIFYLPKCFVYYMLRQVFALQLCSIITLVNRLGKNDVIIGEYENIYGTDRTKINISLPLFTLFLRVSAWSRAWTIQPHVWALLWLAYSN